MMCYQFDVSQVCLQVRIENWVQVWLHYITFILLASAQIIYSIGLSFTLTLILSYVSLTLVILNSRCRKRATF